ncbi:MAG: glycosyltransferase family 39 protein, partial [Elusimicrobia bacterium]|nr:glycosyltransferase family 39 protein [Elusimicrobiota bacterium]
MLIKKEQVLERCLPLWGFWLLLAWSLSILGYYYLASAGSVPVGALFSVLDTFNGFSVTRWVSQFSIPLLWNGWILMACTLFGNTILHWTKVPFSGRCERIVFSMGVGLGTCAYCIFLLGLIHWWNAYSMIGLLVLFSAIGLFSIRSMRGPPSMGPNRVNQRWGWMDTVMTVGLVSLLSLNFLGALSPPIFYDTLVYHLAIPRLYAIAGGIVPTPTNLYTGFPFLTEMLYGLSLILSGETTATLLHYSFGVGILFVLLGFALRYYDRRIGLLAGLLFYATPTIAWESWLTGVELSWGFFTLLALYAFINAIRSEEPANHRRWLCLSALCSGWALCTKYLALVYWFPVALLLVAWS